MVSGSFTRLGVLRHFTWSEALWVFGPACLTLVSALKRWVVFGIDSSPLPLHPSRIQRVPLPFRRSSSITSCWLLFRDLQ